MFVKIVALQEASIKAINAVQYLKDKISKDKDCNTALICLWFDENKHQNKEFIPEKYIDYLQKFKESNITIKSIIVFNENKEILENTHLISNTKQTPSNEIAFEIKKTWGWL